MSAAAFDTLKFPQTLRDKANFSPAQAEGISEAFSAAITGQLATRTDLANLATKDDISRLDSKIEVLRSETGKWIVGAVGFQTLVTVGAVFGLVHFFVH